jgi:hypothetical protein
MVTALLLCGICAEAQAQERKKPAHPAALKKYIADETVRFEREIADRIRRRSETSQQDLPYVELQIDLRVLARWLATQVTAVDAFSDAQAVAWLRYRDIVALIPSVDTWATAQKGNVPTKTQTTALAALHKATFDLKNAGSVGEIDGVLIGLRAPLLLSLGDKDGKAADARPARKPGPTTTATVATPSTATPPAEPLTLDQLSMRVTQLTISVPLRQQLLGAIGVAKAAEGEAADRMTSVLRSAVELAAAVQSNVAVDPAARSQLETEIGEAVALFSDPRLRDAGQKRLDDLKEYRQLTGRVMSLALTPETLRQLQPAFLYANQNPEQGGKVLAAVETFARVDREMAAPRPATQDPIGRQIDAQAKLYTTERAGFLGDIDRLKPGSAVAADPAQITQRVEGMEKISAGIFVLRRLAQSQTTLLELKPRPTGGLEKRITQTVVKLGDNDVSARDTARTYLTDVDRLAQAWTDVRGIIAKPVDDAAMQKFTGMTWSAVDARLRATATEQASTLASPIGGLDDAKLDGMVRGATMIEQVQKLADLESRLAAATAVTRSADCTVTPDKFAKLMDDYRKDFAALFTACLQGGDPKPLTAAVDRYRGVMSVLDRLASLQAECETLPDGTRGLISRLTTPSEGAPFGTIRYLSLMTDLIDLFSGAAEAEPEAIDKLRQQMLDRLNRNN